MQIVDLPVEKRDRFGSASSRRYRREARIPCILYGNRQSNVPLLVKTDDFQRVLKAHTRVVKLRLGADEQTALMREVAWNTYGEHVDHIDFVRVELTDEISIQVPLEFVGIPVGIGMGGVVEAIMNDLDVRCRVNAIPDVIRVDIAHLELFKGVHVEDLKLPEGVVCTRSGRDLVVHVVEPRKLEVAAPAPAEGEVPAEGAAAVPGAEGEAAAAPAAAPGKGEKGKEAAPAKEAAKGKEAPEAKGGKDKDKEKKKGKEK